MLELVNERLIVFGKLSEIWNEHFHEFDEFLSDKTNITLKTQDERLDENGIGKDDDAVSPLVFSRHFFVSEIVLEIAVVQDKVEEVDDVDLHGVVLFLCHLVECLDQWLDDDMGNLVGVLAVLLDLLQDQLHELTG